MIASKPKRSVLNVESKYYSDIEKSYIPLGNLEVFDARKKVMGGILVKKFRLDTIDFTDTCLLKGFDYERDKIFYWDKCNNKIYEL
ncbi:hypothetical protein [Botryobacter ruber]|uniref:hypothetical protein n=1 Tax=Botryobacter ruber TaxID=2171629 RepID=UPI000E0AB626|nr:hypothetical protein [Botryobacter ruber]